MEPETKGTETGAAMLAGSDAATLDCRTGCFTAAEIDSDGIPVVLLNSGQKLEVPQALLDAIDARAEHPRRKTGTSMHHEEPSFCAHVVRNKGPDSAIWANAEKPCIQAIYDYHGPHGQAPGWGQHRALYTLPLSSEWQTWTAGDGKPLTQDAFAEMLDARMEDLASVAEHARPIELLEMARSLQIHTAGTFKRSLNPTTGESSLLCKTEHGQESTKIPRSFCLGIPIFRGGSLYQVECRIAFRLTDQGPRFSYTIHRRAELMQTAVGESVARIADVTKVQVFWGLPES